MHTIQRIRAFKTRNFTVHVDAVEDNDLDLSWDDDGSVRRGLESGKFMAFGVVVKVYCNGSKVGEDSLWNCIYETPREFMDHFGIRQGYGSYFSQMVRAAIAEARKSLSALSRVYVRQ